MKRPAFVLSLAAVWGAASLAHAASCTPEPFAAETDWGAGSDASPAFTPDGRTVLFSRGDGADRRIFLSHKLAHGWSKPAPAPFSGHWMDIEPAMAPDGSYLVFVSNRPITADGKPLDGFFGGAPKPGRGGNLWRVARRRSGWGEPVRLPDTVNISTSVFAPAVAADGSVYFMQPDPTTKKMRLFVSHKRAGRFETATPMPFSDGVTPDFDPAVAPDQSFIVFSSPRAPTPPKQGDLFVSYRVNGVWGAAQHIDFSVTGIEARLSPDLRTLYFDPLSDGPNRIAQVSVASWLPKRLKPDCG